MSKKLIISARTWSTFVESLKGNLKHNFGICEKTLFKNGYYTAVLTSGIDKAYVSRLNTVTGEEIESTLDLCDFLGSCLVPFPQELMTRIEELVGKAEDNKAIDLEKALQTEAVATTIKRARKPRAKK
jgi:hypothetical protein